MPRPGNPLDPVLRLLQRGRDGEALARCRKLAAKRPRDPAVRALHGHLLVRRERWREAISVLERLPVLTPVAALDLARAQRRAGEPLQAAATLEGMLAGARGPEVAIEYGMALREGGRDGDAIAAWERALGRWDAPPLRFNLANALRETGAATDAVAHYQLLLERAGRRPDVLGNLGLALAATGDPAGAEACLEEAAAAEPAGSTALNSLARILASHGRLRDALGACERSLARSPEQPDVLRQVATLARDLEEPERAREALHAALALTPASAEAHADLVALEEEQNALDAAERALAEGLAQAPEDVPLKLLAARLARRRGEPARALEQLRALETPEAAAADDDEFERRRQHELGLVLDRLGRVDEAWEATRSRAALARRRSPPSSFYDDLLRHYADAALAPGDGPAPPETPVFLFGFPRSGTTLSDRLLCEAAGLESIEERGLLDQLFEDRLAGEGPAGSDDSILRRHFETLLKPWRTSERRPLVREPLGFLHLPLVLRLWPTAPIVFVLRHPADVVLSCQFQDFRPNRLTTHLIEAEGASAFFIRTLARWIQWRGALTGSASADEGTQVPTHPLAELRYEALVADPEATIAAALAHLGLEPVNGSPATSAPVARTASYYQVAEPVYDRAAGRWQRYRRQLEPLLPGLAATVTALGYALDGEPGNT